MGRNAISPCRYRAWLVSLTKGVEGRKRAFTSRFSPSYPLSLWERARVRVLRATESAHATTMGTRPANFAVSS